MKLLTFGVVLAWSMLISGFVSHAVDQANENQGRDQAKLKGSWKVVSIEFDGQMIPENIATQLAYLFDGDKVTLKGRILSSAGNYAFQPADHDCTFKVNPAKKPKEIDIAVTKDKTIVGIYEVKGNDLKICLSYANERPKEFSTKGKTGAAFLTLKRD